MSRKLRVAAAQMGPIQRADSRASVVGRMTELMREAAGKGAQLVCFPELTLTTFFPRWWMEDPQEVDAFFEAEMPGPHTRPLFDTAANLGLGFSFGYAELVREPQRTRHFNTSILVDESGSIVGKYRKVHIPGHADDRSQYPYQHLEQKYFEVGDLGFPVWRTMGGLVGMCICNDRRWPETYRVMGLQGVELVLCGYNTPTHVPWEPIYDELTEFHSHLSMQAGAYQNSTWVIGTAKAGREENCNMLGGSCIIAPSGEIVAKAISKSDEVIVADCDLDLCQHNKKWMFNFDAYRRIEHYGRITSQTGIVEPVA